MGLCKSLIGIGFGCVTGSASHGVVNSATCCYNGFINLTILFRRYYILFLLCFYCISFYYLLSHSPKLPSSFTSCRTFNLQALLNSYNSNNNNNNQNNPNTTTKTIDFSPQPTTSSMFYDKPSFGAGRIPKLVHYMYRTQFIPQQLTALCKKCMKLNPDHTFLFWTDEIGEELLLQIAPTMDGDNGQRIKDFLLLLHSHHGLARSDLLRLLLLYYIGGVYMDMDTECHRPLTQAFYEIGQKETILQEIHCILDQEVLVQTRVLWNKPYSAMNNFMACSRGHPFLKYTLDHLDEPDHWTDVVLLTGPGLVTRRYEEYGRLTPCTNNKTLLNSVYLANPSWFSPIANDINDLKKRCYWFSQKTFKGGGWRRIACEIDLPNYIKNAEFDKNQAYLEHKFLHLGYSIYNFNVKQMEDICYGDNAIFKPIL